MTGAKFEKLVEIMATLRGPNGCPWDKEQTFDTLKPMMVTLSTFQKRLSFLAYMIPRMRPSCESQRNPMSAMRPCTSYPSECYSLSFLAPSCTIMYRQGRRGLRLFHKPNMPASAAAVATQMPMAELLDDRQRSVEVK